MSKHLLRSGAADVLCHLHAAGVGIAAVWHVVGAEVIVEVEKLLVDGHHVLTSYLMGKAVAAYGEGIEGGIDDLYAAHVDGDLSIPQQILGGEAFGEGDVGVVEEELTTDEFAMGNHLLEQQHTLAEVPHVILYKVIARIEDVSLLEIVAVVAQWVEEAYLLVAVEVFIECGEGIGEIEVIGINEEYPLAMGMLQTDITCVTGTTILGQGDERNVIAQLRYGVAAIIYDNDLNILTLGYRVKASPQQVRDVLMWYDDTVILHKCVFFNRCAWLHKLSLIRH